MLHKHGRFWSPWVSLQQQRRTKEKKTRRISKNAYWQKPLVLLSYACKHTHTHTYSCSEGHTDARVCAAHQSPFGIMRLLYTLCLDWLMYSSICVGSAFCTYEHIYTQPHIEWLFFIIWYINTMYCCSDVRSCGLPLNAIIVGAHTHEHRAFREDESKWNNGGTFWAFWCAHTHILNVK